MNLREALENVPTLKFVVEKMELMAAPSRRILLNTPFLTSEADINKELDFTEQFQSLDIEPVKHLLMQVRDISGTIKRLAQRGILDDIELFEIKSFALLAAQIREWIRNCAILGVDVPNLDSVIELLDPEGLKVPHFYIYDCYDPALKQVRSRYHFTPSDTLYQEMSEIEDRIRARLSQKLWSQAQPLSQALYGIARLDIGSAKCQVAAELELCRPAISPTTTSFQGLFNPAVQAMLRERGLTFQPVDITVPQGVTVITGANMGGKTVALKSLATAQALMQFGFFVPAKKAEITPVRDIMISIGDGTSDEKGLSSFGAEMVRISAILTSIKSERPVLILIDEPARTTNPVEGHALVSALIHTLNLPYVRCVITTHYSNLSERVNRLRVKGLKPCETLTLGSLNNQIDYSLIPDLETAAPHEALKIAEMLGVDQEFLNTAKQYLNK